MISINADELLFYNYEIDFRDVSSSRKKNDKVNQLDVGNEKDQHKVTKNKT